MKRFTTLFAPEGDGGGGGGFTPSFEGALKADGSFAEGWASKAFGADYKGPLSTAKTLGDVNKMLTDAMTAARQKTEGMVRIPGQDAKPEEIAAYRKAIGVPEKPEDYAHTLPEGVTDAQLNKDMLNAWKQRLHQQGIGKSQAESIINEYLKEQAANTAKDMEALKKSLEEEKADLAKRFPEIDKTVAAVKALANKQGVPESLKNAIANGAFDPTNQGAFWGADAFETLAWVAKALGEDRAPGGGGAAGGMTIAEAQKIMNDKSHPLHEKYTKGDAEVAAKIKAAYAAGV